MSVILKNSNFEMVITTKQVYTLYQISGLVKLYMNECFNSSIIYIPDYVSEESMNYIIEFCDIYIEFGEIFFPITDIKFQNYVGEDIYVWLLFFKNKRLFNLLNIANCLCVDSLIEIICMKIFLDIKDMSVSDAELYFTYI